MAWGVRRWLGVQKAGRGVALRCGAGPRDGAMREACTFSINQLVVWPLSPGFFSTVGIVIRESVVEVMFISPQTLRVNFSQPRHQTDSLRQAGRSEHGWFR